MPWAASVKSLLLLLPIPNHTSHLPPLLDATIPLRNPGAAVAVQHLPLLPGATMPFSKAAIGTPAAVAQAAHTCCEARRHPHLQVAIMQQQTQRQQQACRPEAAAAALSTKTLHHAAAPVRQRSKQLQGQRLQYRPLRLLAQQGCL